MRRATFTEDNPMTTDQPTPTFPQAPIPTTPDEFRKWTGAPLPEPIPPSEWWQPPTPPRPSPPPPPSMPIPPGFVPVPPVLPREPEPLKEFQNPDLYYMACDLPARGWGPVSMHYLEQCVRPDAARHCRGLYRREVIRSFEQATPTLRDAAIRADQEELRTGRPGYWQLVNPRDIGAWNMPGCQARGWKRQ